MASKDPELIKRRLFTDGYNAICDEFDVFNTIDLKVAGLVAAVITHLNLEDAVDKVWHDSHNSARAVQSYIMSIQAVELILTQIRCEPNLQSKQQFRIERSWRDASWVAGGVTVWVVAAGRVACVRTLFPLCGAAEAASHTVRGFCCQSHSHFATTPLSYSCLLHCTACCFRLS